MTIAFRSLSSRPEARSVTLRTILAMFDAGMCSESVLSMNLARLMVARAVVQGRAV